MKKGGGGGRVLTQHNITQHDTTQHDVTYLRAITDACVSARESESGLQGAIQGH